MKTEPPDFMKKMRVPTKQAQPVLPLVGEIPPGMCPQPLPVWVTSGAVQVGEGQRMIIMQMATPAAVSFYIVTPEQAKGIAEGLLEMARAAESGIVIVPGGG